jgi:peptide/nickel transport system permease protein
VTSLEVASGPQQEADARPGPGGWRRAGSWLIAKTARGVATLIGVIVLVFIILRLVPGNQITASIGISAGLLTRAQRAALDHFYGIGLPLPEQFWRWIDGLAHGNMGISVQSGRSVTSLIWSALPVTFELAVMAMIIGLILGIGLGVVSAAAPGRLPDWTGQAFALLGLGIPTFVLGAGMVAFFAAVFHYFPSSLNYASLTSNPWLNFQQIIFPAIALGIQVGAPVYRATRGAMLDVSRLAFVRAARGKGLRGRTVVVRHILRNALVPIATMSGIQFGYLLGGTVIVEQIFVLPGLGSMLLTAVNEHDYAVAQGVTLVFAAGFIIVNILTDALYILIDPRVRS